MAIGVTVTILCAFISTNLASKCEVHVPSNLTLKVNENVTIEFNLEGDCFCSGRNTLKLNRMLDGSGDDELMCQAFLPVHNGETAECGCQQSQESPCTVKCQYERMMVQSDRATWAVQIIGKSNLDKTFHVDVGYPPDITGISVGGRPDQQTAVISQGARDVDVTCGFKNGNPRKEMILIGPSFQTLGRSKDKSATLKTRLGSVQCSHAGSYRCYAKDEGLEKKVLLLVKCPLKVVGGGDNATFETDPQAASTQRWDVTVTSYTTSITCTMRHLSTLTSPGQQRDCTSLVAVSGAAPDLKVTVALTILTDLETGPWRLSLSNGRGQAHHLYFTLVNSSLAGEGSVIADDSSAMEVDITMVPFGITLLAIICVIVITIIIVVVAVKKTGQDSSTYKTDYARASLSNAAVRDHNGTNTVRPANTNQRDHDGTNTVRPANTNQRDHDGTNTVRPANTNQRDHDGTNTARPADRDQRDHDGAYAVRNSNTEPPIYGNENVEGEREEEEGAVAGAGGGGEGRGSVVVDSRVANEEGCLYGQLDFSNWRPRQPPRPRASVVDDDPSTIYTTVSFEVVPPSQPSP